MKNNSINAHKEANKTFEDYMMKKSEYIFIHYARENCFEDAYEKGPRTIAIIVMNAESEQTRVFSLKKSTETQGIDFFALSEAEKDKIEYEMMKSFYEYVEVNKDKKWLHWNMKNNNFGFSALEDRFKELGGTPTILQESNMINMSVLLKKKYGTNFAQDNAWNGKMMGKMYDIFYLNKIDDTNILNGVQEVKEYILKNIMLIEQSVLGKVKAYKIIVEKAADNALVTRAKVLKDVYGLSIKGIAQYIQDNAFLAICCAIVSSIVATIICKIAGI